MVVNIYVGNLPHDMSPVELGDLFKPFGQVARSKIMADRYTGKSKGFGFIEMEDAQQANNAIESLNGTNHKNRPLTVKLARRRKNQRQFSSPSYPSGGGSYRPKGRGDRNRS
jgi:RNA recognition motif-containing protein